MTSNASSVIAAIAVFAFGALAVAGKPTEAAAGGVALTAVLASREVLHGWLQRVTWIELRSALVLAVMTAIVLPLLPDTPTYAEQGVPTPPDFSGWWMLTAPAGTPTEILDRLNAEAGTALNNPEVRASLNRAGLVPIPSTRDEALRYQRDQLQVWGRMIRELGLKI